MNVVTNLVVGLLGNVIFWAGLGLVVLVPVQLARRRLTRFFGLRREEPLLVYLSNLWLPRHKPEGRVLAGCEFGVGVTIDGLLGRVPLRYPDILRGFVDSFWIEGRPKVEYRVSPLTADGLEFGNMIVVGATAKNSARREYYRTGLPWLGFVGEKAVPPRKPLLKEITNNVEVLQGQDVGKVVTGKYNLEKAQWNDDKEHGALTGERNLAIVERTYDKERGAVVFMCVGFRSDSSWAAVEYLVRHWQELDRDHPGEGLALCLGFPWTHEFMRGYKEPVVLAFYSFKAGR